MLVDLDILVTQYKYYCYECGWNAKIELWESLLDVKWLCRHCGLHGSFSDNEHPRLLHKNSQGENEPCYDFSQRVFIS